MKGDDRWLHIPDGVLATYNAHDCIATALLAKRVTQELAANKQLPFYEAEVWPSLAAVLAMQRRGLPYDSKTKGLYRKRLRAELAETDDALRTAFTATSRPPPQVVGAATVTLLQWLGLLPSTKALRRRKAPFTKAEWAKLSKWMPAGFNPGSDHQLRAWLFGPTGLGLRPSTHTETKLPSVDQDALNRILQRRPSSKEEAARVAAAVPVLHNLMHRSRLSKIDTDYLDPDVVADPLGADAAKGRGRVYPTIKMLGTKSGRFAYADPPVHSWPPEIRHLVRPAPGYLILSADMRAIESRIFSLLTKDPVDLRVFEMNAKDPKEPLWDIHIRTACELFAWKLDDYLGFEEAKQEGARMVAKTFRYGVIQYGGQPETAKTKVFCPCVRCKAPPSVELTPAEKKRQADRWFKVHWQAKEWRRTISETAQRTHRLANPFGQIRFFHSPWNSETEREAWNWPIQSSATVVLRRGMRRLHEMGAPLILEHHDALYLESPEADLGLWAGRVRETLEAPVAEFGGFSFPVELKSGPSWGELRKWTS